jgi:hypothetical protein
MISNSRLQITLLSFLFKKFNIIKKGINIQKSIKIHWNYMLSCQLFHIRKCRPSGFKAIIKSIFKTKLPSLTSAPFFSRFFRPFFLEIYNLEILQKCEQKWNIFARNLSIIKSRNVSYFAVVIMRTLNWTNQCPLFMTVRHIFEISEDDHPRTLTHARDIWWTLDFPNAFVSRGVNSRGELVPSHGASRSRLGDQSCFALMRTLIAFDTLKAPIKHW